MATQTLPHVVQFPQSVPAVEPITQLELETVSLAPQSPEATRSGSRGRGSNTQGSARIGRDDRSRRSRCRAEGKLPPKRELGKMSLSDWRTGSS